MTRKEYYEKNKEKIKERAKEYYKKRKQDPEYVERTRKNAKEYYEKNKTDVLFKQKLKNAWSSWHKDNVDQLRHINRKAGAKRRHNDLFPDIHFDLDMNKVEKPTHCPILGIELDYVGKGGKTNTASLDRVIPEKGYTTENVRYISLCANSIKSDLSLEEITKKIEILKRIKEYIESNTN